MTTYNDAVIFSSGASAIDNALHHIALLDRVDDVLALRSPGRTPMLAVEPGRGDVRDEELRAVGVRAGVGHRQHCPARCA